MSGLISEISKLSLLERIQLVQEILKTISRDTKKENDFHLTDNQINEMENRSASIKQGEAKTTSWESIENSLKEKYGL